MVQEFSLKVECGPLLVYFHIFVHLVQVVVIQAKTERLLIHLIVIYVSKCALIIF